MKLVAFGIGYVGLVTGTGLSELGHEVLCVDIDPERVRQLEGGAIPIYEPGLADLVRRNVRAGRLRFATEVVAPFDEADAYFIAVGTPPGADGAADISAVLASRSPTASRRPPRSRRWPSSRARCPSARATRSRRGSTPSAR
jgi:UDPglucose 6-dehydrogenase